MPSFMRCTVQRPQQCRAIIIYDGIVHNWRQLDVPGWGVLCFCPEHEDAYQHALKIANDHAFRKAAKDFLWMINDPRWNQKST